MNKKINNNLLLKVILAVYYILMHDSYILMHKSSNHHYIPRFILKKFKIIDTGLIFQYARGKNPERKSIEKEAACIENLYSFNDKFSKSKSDFIENQLFAFSLEKYASRIIRQIIDEKIEGIHDLILRLSIQIGDHLSYLIYKRKLNFLNAYEPAFFYLSDSPAEIFNITKNRTVGPFLWEMEDNPLIFMPILPNLCLYFLKDTIPPPHIIGRVIEVAIPKSVHDFAFSDRLNDKIIID